MKQGVCKLCQKKRPLCQSHLMPKGAYALCRAKHAKNPNPLLISYNFTMQTSRQLKTPLLCFDCEQLLREKGEDWVIPQLARVGGPFLLDASLRASPPLFTEPDLVAYALETIKGIHVPDLIHFAMGIFWKSAVHSWVKKEAEPWLSLGPYTEPVRKFLLGETPFPVEMALSLSVLPSPVALISFHYPIATIEADPVCMLYICGLSYMLWMGPNIPDEVARTSLHRPPHALLVVDNRDDITKKFREAYEAAMKAKWKRDR